MSLSAGRRAPVVLRRTTPLSTSFDDLAEQPLLRAWARILREAAEAERFARPVLRVVDRAPRRRLEQGP
jgi:hypothetical protein